MNGNFPIVGFEGDLSFTPYAIEKVKTGRYSQTRTTRFKERLLQKSNAILCCKTSF